MAEKTTSQVASEIGIPRKTILSFIARHPELVPAKRLSPSNDYLWTDEEIEAFRHRSLSKPGRPKKAQVQP